MRVHEFRSKLRQSQSHDNLMEAAYRKYFWNYQDMKTCTGEGFEKEQSQGIDRLVLLTNGQVIKIEEKIRNSFFSSLLIEYLSAEETGALGWIEKPLKVDYLVCVHLAISDWAQEKNLKPDIWFIPFPLLQRAWWMNKERWIDTLPIRRCQTPRMNGGRYTTVSCEVSWKILFDAIKQAACMSLDDLSTESDWQVVEEVEYGLPNGAGSGILPL